MSIDAARVHGLDDAFLRDKPLFVAIVGELIEFVGDARLIAHNAQFDLDFLNLELGRVGHPALIAERIVNSLMLAAGTRPARIRWTRLRPLPDRPLAAHLARRASRRRAARRSLSS